MIGLLVTFGMLIGLQEEKKPADPLNEPAKWNELTLGKNAKLTFYGFLRLDVILDDSRPDNSQVIGFVKSEDPAADAALRAPKNDGDFTMHPRLTRFGIDFDGPTIEPLGNAKITGKLEIDFYNLLPSTVGPTSNSREFVRMRHAWAKLSWEQFSLLAGQREDVIAPIFPIVNGDLVMWGAGNLGDRRPQIRLEGSNGTFTATGMLGLTGADDARDLDANGILDGEDSGLPTVQARLGLAVDGWVEKQKIAGGVWGHWAKEELATPLAGTSEDEFTSWALGFDLTLPILDNVWLKGELWTGQNLDDVRGGIFQGVNGSTGKEIDSTGGWVEIGWKAMDWYALTLGASFDDPDDKDLPTSGATTGKDLNRIFYLANRFTFGPVEIGADYLYWTTEYVSVGDGTDHRLNFFLSYKF